MAVYNRAPVVAGAIRSVLAQSFDDLELLVIDDGSDDGSFDVASAFDDPRVRVLRHSENLGIPRTRNHGLSEARGEYLAILDSDDRAFPRRLEHQVAFLDRNPGIAAVGGWATRIRANGRRTSPVIRPTDPLEIRARIPFSTCFKNPTMMGRTAALREFGYREEFVICQDIDMWSRMSVKYPLANLPRFLIQYRLGGFSHNDKQLAATMKKRAAADQLRYLGVDFDSSDLDRHYMLRNPKNFRFSREDLEWSEDWLLRLLAANRANRCYPEPQFSQAAAERWWRVALVTLRARRSLRPFLQRSALRSGLPGVLAGLGRTGWQQVTSRVSSAWL
jgi:glycosyltransferase involved in cell wall biosynthesis